MASKPKPKLQSDFPRIASLRDDILTGAEEIADYLGWPIRRVYYLAQRGCLPTVKIGELLVARKSQLEVVFSAPGISIIAARALSGETKSAEIA